MMKSINIMLLLFIAGCGDQVINNRVTLLEVVQQWEATFGPTKAQFFFSSDLSQSTAAVAHIYRRGFSRVYFNKHVWDTASNGNRKYMVFHELGHTIGLKHDMRFTGDCPSSLMHPVNLKIWERCYNDNYLIKLKGEV